MTARLGVVFDLDGVVIDVRQSYRRAYIDGVVAALQGCGFELRGAPFTVEDVHALKRHPGFNAPRDTVGFLLLGCLAGAERHPGSPLSADSCRFGEWIDARARELGDWRGRLLRGLPSSALARIAATEARCDALRWCHEAYVGSAEVERVYGVAPLGDLPGRTADDRLVLDPDRRIAAPVAVYTGRTRREARLVMARFAIFSKVPEALVLTTDDGFYKPDPAPLGIFADRMRAERLVYIGDTAADREVVRRHRLGGGSPCDLAQVVGDDAAPWPEAVVRGASADEVLDGLGFGGPGSWTSPTSRRRCSR